ncbi:MAG: hypothetical protein AB1644_05775 [Candidatus Zixiibacteriota bacterium]
MSKRVLLGILSSLVVVAIAFMALAGDQPQTPPKSPAKGAEKSIGATESMGKATLGPIDKGSEISVKISGPGAVDASTIKVGEKVSIDLYFSNSKPRKAFTTGFKLSSPDIKTLEHPADPGMGVNETGDIKGHNGWNDNSVWDLKGLLVNKGDWDGTLPDYVGIGGVAVKQRFQPQASTKQVSFDLVVPEAGTLVVDSVFFPPGGYWKFSDNDRPAWGGPYTFKVVK